MRSNLQLSDNPNELLVQVSLSNQKAFKKLYDLTAAKLFGISLRITRQERLSEDILQESFMKIWHNASRFDPEKAQAITWMGTIVRNQSIDEIRKNAKHNNNEKLEEDSGIFLSEEKTPEQLAIKSSDLTVVNQCLSALAEKYKHLILLAYLDGYSHQQIAEIKNMPIGSVKTGIHRGVKWLRNCISKN